jgi:hypothetical protein
MEQAKDERTFEDLLLHLKKAISHMDLVFDGKANMFERDKLLHQAHDRVVRAYNTAAFIREQVSGR